jgi:curved DNA-binding protein CbpA
LVNTEDLFSILELESGCSLKEVKQAFRKFALMYHPDMNPGDPLSSEKFQRVQGAYEQIIKLNLAQEKPSDHRYGANVGRSGPLPKEEPKADRGSRVARRIYTPEQGDLMYILKLQQEEARRGLEKIINYIRLEKGRPTNEKVLITIPPGVISGQMLRLPRKGDLFPLSAAPGDLFIKISL